MTDWLTAQINSSKNTKLIHKQNPKKIKMEFQKNVKWSDWSEVKRNEKNTTGSGVNEVGISEVKWSEVKWSEVKWSEVNWSEVKWSELNRIELI